MSLSGGERLLAELIKRDISQLSRPLYFFKKMAGNNEPPDPGRDGVSPPAVPSSATLGATYASAMTSNQVTMTAKTVAGGQRTWKQIIEDAKKQNILQIRMLKTSKTVNGETIKPRNLRHDDIATFIFDYLGIKPEECIGFDYNTGRYDTREIQLKSDIDTTRFLRVEPIVFMEHNITVASLNTRSTKVTFRNVPLNVPDEELLHLAYHYGKPVDNMVTRETLTNDKNRGMKGSTRFIEMNLDEGKTFLNYYWLEGPLPGDRGRRVTVTHGGQVQQCSHCLRRAGQGCPAAGNGYNCEKAGTKRALMKEYMNNVRTKTGYVSLKMKEAEANARAFPSLYPEHQDGPTFDMEEEPLDNGVSVDEPIIYRNPIEEKDFVITEKDKLIDKLENKIKEQEAIVTNGLSRIETAENSAKNHRTKTNILAQHLSRAKSVVEMKLIEKIQDTASDPTENKEDIGFEVTTLATLLLQDEEIEENKTFEKMKEMLNKNDPDQVRKFEVIKDLVIDRHKSIKQQRGRRASFSKRKASDEGERSTSRPRNNE